MRSERVWPQQIMLEELCKRIQHCCASLRRSRNKRMLGVVGWKIWPVSNFAQLLCLRATFDTLPLFFSRSFRVRHVNSTQGIWDRPEFALGQSDERVIAFFCQGMGEGFKFEKTSRKPNFMPDMTSHTIQTLSVNTESRLSTVSAINGFLIVEIWVFS